MGEIRALIDEVLKSMVYEVREPQQGRQILKCKIERLRDVLLHMEERKELSTAANAGSVITEYLVGTVGIKGFGYMKLTQVNNRVDRLLKQGAKFKRRSQE